MVFSRFTQPSGNDDRLTRLETLVSQLQTKLQQKSVEIQDLTQVAIRQDSVIQTQNSEIGKQRTTIASLITDLTSINQRLTDRETYLSNNLNSINQRLSDRESVLLDLMKQHDNEVTRNTDIINSALSKLGSMDKQLVDREAYNESLYNQIMERMAENSTSTRLLKENFETLIKTDKEERLLVLNETINTKNQTSSIAGGVRQDRIWVTDNRTIIETLRNEVFGEKDRVRLVGDQSIAAILNEKANTESSMVNFKYQLDNAAKLMVRAQTLWDSINQFGLQDLEGYVVSLGKRINEINLSVGNFYQTVSVENANRTNQWSTLWQNLQAKEDSISQIIVWAKNGVNEVNGNIQAYRELVTINLGIVPKIIAAREEVDRVIANWRGEYDHFKTWVGDTLDAAKSNVEYFVSQLDGLAPAFLGKITTWLRENWGSSGIMEFITNGIQTAWNQEPNLASDRPSYPVSNTSIQNRFIDFKRLFTGIISRIQLEVQEHILNPIRFTMNKIIDFLFTTYDAIRALIKMSIATFNNSRARAASTIAWAGLLNDFYQKYVKNGGRDLAITLDNYLSLFGDIWKVIWGTAQFGYDTIVQTITGVKNIYNNVQVTKEFYDKYKLMFNDTYHSLSIYPPSLEYFLSYWRRLEKIRINMPTNFLLEDGSTFIPNNIEVTYE